MKPTHKCQRSFLAQEGVWSSWHQFALKYDLPSPFGNFLMSIICQNRNFSFYALQQFASERLEKLMIPFYSSLHRWFLTCLYLPNTLSIDHQSLIFCDTNIILSMFQWKQLLVSCQNLKQFGLTAIHVNSKHGLIIYFLAIIFPLENMKLLKIFSLQKCAEKNIAVKRDII